MKCSLSICHMQGHRKINKSKGEGQKYSRLRYLLRVKGLVIGFYLGWSGSILGFRKI